jgi:glutaredoxin 3
MSDSFKKVVVYSTNFCPYCVAAKKLLDSKKIPFEEINVQTDFEKREWLVKTTGQRTVPQIFIDNVSIGGFDELSALDSSGELDVIVKK